MSKSEQTKKMKNRSGWWWVPSLYFAEGIPYVVVMTVSVIMYKNLGISNAKIALYTSWLYLPWVIKPLWSPLVDILRTKRFWIITMQLIVGAGLGGVALSIPAPDFFKFTLIFLWLLAFSSATHDIAADGFYMLGLNQHEQAYFVGIRSTFYRFAMIFGQGILIMLAGFIESHTGLQKLDIQVYSQPDAMVQEFKMNSVDGYPALDGELRLINEPEILYIDTTPKANSEIDSLLKLVKEWNISRGQVYEDPGLRRVKTSWFTKQLSDPLKHTLKAHFGEKPIPTQQIVGNVGFVYLRLSQKPTTDKDIIVNFGRSKGDKSISLIDGTRFVFNQNNWNKPVVAVIQLDQKLRSRTNAVFSAKSGNTKLAWSITFFIIMALFIVFFIYHKLMLPHPIADISHNNVQAGQIFSEFFKTFAAFFKKEKIGISIAFLLLFRLGESQLVKLASPFLLDSQEMGGIGLTTGQIGLVYGTVGILFLTLGGILGGIAASRYGLKKWIFWMAVAINVPDVVYIYMSQVQPDNFLIINICVAFEQFGYGFGFTAYMLYMIIVAEGDHKTAHYAICTAFMALGMMIPGMLSGWIQEIIGYQNFFVWVIIATIPGFLLIRFLPIPKDFGIKKQAS
ncbi:MAG TPA: MFS transporter [Candidatus Marinimicrobia bacterium]|nr:MFS transporter [Candidatus Neomarinimicrobiota bacterium]